MSLPARFFTHPSRWVIFVAVALLVGAGVWLNRQPNLQAPVPPPVAPSAPVVAPAPPRQPEAPAPAIPVADGYVGATACQGCHPQQHERWLADRHARALSTVPPGARGAHFAIRHGDYECLDCHVSGLRVRYDRDRHRFQTAFVDASVACESCHGPGARHAQTKAPADIVHPGKWNRRKSDRRRALGICAQCHGARQPLFPIFDADHRYRPGESYEELHQPLLFVNGNERSGDFFPDGRPQSLGFEYQALLQSRCFLRGQVSCLDCHTEPHGTQRADEACRRCHANFFAPTARARHTQHRSAQAQSCVACHMPKVVSGVHGALADHALDVPVPQNTSRHGVKNACATCHKDDSAESLAQSLHRLWPDAARRQARRLRLADAIDEQTAAQSQPALLAVIADETEAPSLRATCALLLGQRFAQDAAALLPLLTHADPLLRARAIEALGQARLRSAADRIAQRLDDRSLAVRHAAALALARFGDPRAEAALRKMARDPATSGLPNPHFALGLLALRQGDLVAATTRLEHTVARVPSFTDALLALAEVYARRGQLATARQRLEDVLRFDPQNRAAAEQLKRMP